MMSLSSDSFSRNSAKSRQLSAMVSSSSWFLAKDTIPHVRPMSWPLLRFFSFLVCGFTPLLMMSLGWIGQL